MKFIIRRDKKNKFRFASLQSSFGKEFLNHFQLQPAQNKSIVLYENGRLYYKSEAVIKILAALEGGWKLFGAFRIIPKFIRDFFYDIIAKTRYAIFGKRKKCMIPSAEHAEKFLDTTSFQPL